MWRHIPARNVIEATKQRARQARKDQQRLDAPHESSYSPQIVTLAQSYRGGLIHLEDIPSRLRSDVCAWLIDHPRFRRKG